MWKSKSQKRIFSNTILCKVKTIKIKNLLFRNTYRYKIILKGKQEDSECRIQNVGLFVIIEMNQIILKNGLNLSYLSLQLPPLQYHFAPSSIKRQSLFFHPVSLDWPWDSLWWIRWYRNDSVLVPSLGLSPLDPCLCQENMSRTHATNILEANIQDH